MTDVIDMSVVHELLDLSDDGDPELLLDLIEMFLEDSPSRVESIRDGLAASDLEAVERAAHSLKGSAGNLGALHVQDVAEALQVASRRADLDRAGELAEALQRHYAEAETALKALATRFG